MRKKTEKKAFILFTERCEKLGYQYFVDTKIEYPMCYWWYKGLTRQQVLEMGCVRTVSDLGSLWNASYRFLKDIKKAPDFSGASIMIVNKA